MNNLSMMISKSIPQQRILWQNLAAVVVIFTICGCTIHRAVSLKSEPSGATVTIDGKQRGQTPWTTTLKWKKDQSPSDTRTLVFDLPYYETARRDLSYEDAKAWTNATPWEIPVVSLKLLEGTSTIHIETDPKGADITLGDGRAFKSRS